MTIRAVIFDVGGVLSRVQDRSKMRVWEARLGLPERGLGKVIFGTEASARAMVGQMSEVELWRYVGATLGLDAQQLDELQRDFWSGWQVDMELVQFLHDLRPRCKTALLSNALSDSRAAFTEFGLIEAVDVTVISAEVGCAKPDPRIYRIALEQLLVPPPAAVFVDDMLENVQAAQSLGMKGVQFKSAQQTIQEIMEYLEGYCPPSPA